MLRKSLLSIVNKTNLRRSISLSHAACARRECSFNRKMLKKNRGIPYFLFRNRAADRTKK